MLLAAILACAVTGCTTAPPVRSEPEPESPDVRSQEVPEPGAPSEPAPRPEPEPEPEPTPPTPTPADETTPVDLEVADAPSGSPAGAGEPPAPADPVTAPGDPPDAAATPPAAPGEPDTAAAAAVVRGRVRLDVSRVDEVDDDSVRDTIVYFKPDGASITVDPRDFEIVTRRKRFLPNVLAVPAGSTVAFPNEDDILHNVFSVSPTASFDLELYGQGESKSHTFTQPGLAVIHCNVHHAMRADVLVVDTPFLAYAGPDGSYSIGGIAPGTGELVAWHPRAGYARRQVRLPLSEPVDIELVLTRPRIPDHLDKTGQPYRPERPSRR